MKTKITHLTSAHPRYDTRIFIKMCSSLAKNDDYEVSLVVADGQGHENKNKVKIFDVGAKTGGRISRMTTTVKNVYEKAKELDSDIYHLHDPELIFVGLKLKKHGKKVIFDSHEDVPKQLMAKHYLNSVTKKIASTIYKIYEKNSLKKFDFIVAATPIIRDKFLSYGCKSIDVNNYPILEEFHEIDSKKVHNQIAYIGALYNTRGVKEIVQALEYLDGVTLVLAGAFFSNKFEDEVKSLKAWKRVDFRGFVGRDEVNEILQTSVLGLVTLHPTPSYIESLPVKMFEYMSAGIPVIASDFEYWKIIVEGANCGICVNPLEPKSIASAIKEIIDNPVLAQSMAKNGKEAVLDKYNWTMEEKKLFEVYKGLIHE